MSNILIFTKTVNNVTLTVHRTTEALLNTDYSLLRQHVRITILKAVVVVAMYHLYIVGKLPSKIRFLIPT